MQKYGSYVVTVSAFTLTVLPVEIGVSLKLSPPSSVKGSSPATVVGRDDGTPSYKKISVYWCSSRDMSIFFFLAH